jgi:hypothetical protein
VGRCGGDGLRLDGRGVIDVGLHFCLLKDAGTAAIINCREFALLPAFQ